MRKCRCCILVLLVFFVQVIISGNAVAQVQKRSYSIPFQLTDHNNIAILALLNNRDTVALMFHTAADDVTLTEDATGKISSVHFNGKADSVQSWGGGDNSSRFSHGNSLLMGQLQLNNITIWEDKNSGQYTDGKVGMNFFKNKVIEIDFDKETITITDELPAGIETYDKLELINSNNMMFVNAGCQVGDSLFMHPFLIHTGYSGAVLLDDDFVNEKQIGTQVQIIGEKDLTDAYGNIIKTKKAILSGLQIGNKKIADVPAGFFEGSIGRQKMSIIGGAVLRRFNIIIDAQRTFIYLKPGHFDNTEFTNS